MLQAQGTAWFDGLSLYVKLVLLAVAGAMAWVGYKINSELFKPGGVVERLNEHDTLLATNETDHEDYERRIGELERWRHNRR